MSTEFRLCVRKVAIFALCLCAFDLVIGGLSRIVFLEQRSGKFHRIHETMSVASQRLFVFGSSHAAANYVPEVLEKELGISSYNAGVLGQQILFHKTLESIVLERVSPDVFILDVDASTLCKTKAHYDRLADLRPFYFRYPSIIGPVLEARSPFERVFLWSMLYQYNSTLAHVIRYEIAPQKDRNGYRPLFGAMGAPSPEEERATIGMEQAFGAGCTLDPVMMDAMERFAADAVHRNVRVFYFVSPGAFPYDLDANVSFRAVRTIVARSRIPFFNFRNHPKFVRQYTLFNDSEHLNDIGARRYSQLVADTVKAFVPTAGSTFRLDTPRRYEGPRRQGAFGGAMRAK